VAHRLGAERITSIEIDPDVATRARTALSNSGFGAVTVVTGEGAIGHPSGAPYDRGVVTAACHRVPYSWVAQARPGGRIVVPWADTYAGALTLHPSTVTGPHGARIAIGQRVPGCQWRYWPWEPSEAVGVLWLVDPWGSWAKLTHTSPGADEDEFPVLQSGPQQLWDEVEAACHWWRDAGSPDADRWWFTVSPDEQRVQLI
jgi:Protein-L-isoaspartate(D-aspartate) O-methyltransferase (PCMT)